VLKCNDILLSIYLYKIMSNYWLKSIKWKQLLKQKINFVLKMLVLIVDFR